MGIVEKSFPLNLFYHILKFGNICITCYRFLIFGELSLFEVEYPLVEFQVREANLFFNSTLG